MERPRISNLGVFAQQLYFDLQSAPPGGELNLTGTDRYFVFETLCEGLRMEIHALKLDDKQELAATVSRAGAQSRYRRFFTVRRNFFEQEADSRKRGLCQSRRLAVADENGHPTIIGGGRYVPVRVDVAELAFTVIDEYQVTRTKAKWPTATLTRHGPARPPESVTARSPGIQTCPPNAYAWSSTQRQKRLKAILEIKRSYPCIVSSVRT
jgi:hypothetical protein